MRDNLYYFLSLFSLVLWPAIISSLLPLCGGQNSLLLGALVEAGYYLEKKKKKERKLASLGAWLVFWFFSLVKLFFCGRTLLGGEEGGWWFLILEDRCPHNVRGQKRNTVEDQEVFLQGITSNFSFRIILVIYGNNTKYKRLTFQYFEYVFRSCVLLFYFFLVI